jgi:parallel beta-helix repeat protein
MFGLILVASGRPAAALSCGDTIGPGGAVTLTENLIGPCESNPVLRVIGPIDLDLNGYTVSCGGRTHDSGGANYTGILLEGNSAYVRNGSIADCGDGLLIGGPGVTAHTILQVTARDNFRRGINVGSRGNRLIGNTVVRNRVGVNLRGGLNVLMQTDARNNVIGIEITEQDSDTLESNLLVANTATHNDDVGFSIVDAKGNTLIGNKATQNGAQGFRIDGHKNVLLDNIAKKNAGDGVSIGSSGGGPKYGNLVDGSIVQNNGGHGIALHCTHCGPPGGSHRVTSNTAGGHAAPHFDLVDDFPKCDSNIWTQNTFGSRSRKCIH